MIACPECGSEGLHDRIYRNTRIVGWDGVMRPRRLVAYDCRDCRHVWFV
jgi:hypothetical protein